MKLFNDNFMKHIYLLTIFDEYLGDIKHAFKNLNSLKIFLSEIIKNRYGLSDKETKHIMSDIDEGWDSTNIKDSNVTISVEEINFE